MDRCRRCGPARRSTQDQTYVVDIPEPAPATPEPEAAAAPHRLRGSGHRRARQAGRDGGPPGGGSQPAARSSTRCSTTSRISAASAASCGPGIVHRLDRGTSGLMVVAKNDRGAPGALAAVHRSRGREGIRRAGLGRGAGRQAHRRADRPRSAAAAEDVDACAARAGRAVTRVTWARHLHGRVAC